MNRLTFAVTPAALAAVALLLILSAPPLATVSAASPASRPTATGASPKSSSTAAPAAAKSGAGRPTSANQYIDMVFGGALQQELKAAKIDPSTATMNTIEFKDKVRTAMVPAVFDFPDLQAPAQAAEKREKSPLAATPPCSIVGASKIQRHENAALSGSFTKKILFGWQIAELTYECKGKFRYAKQPIVNIKAECVMTVTGKGEVQQKGTSLPALTQFTMNPPKCDPKFTGLGSQKYPDQVKEDFARHVSEALTSLTENSLKPALAKAAPQTPFPPVPR